jgi:hypothetical protein
VSRRPALRRNGAVDLSVDGIGVRAGFRLVTKEPLAGGPVELEFFVEPLGTGPLKLAVGGDRMRQRPGQLVFEAELEGTPLPDPFAEVPDMGGPLGLVDVSADQPWRQPLVLNDFVRLEDAIALVEPGEMGRLRLACRRPVVLAAEAARALAADGAELVEVDLAFDVCRDDAALAALVADLLDRVMNGPAAERERPLALLLSLRTTARAQIEALAKHPDETVADRARRALTRLP